PARPARQTRPARTTSFQSFSEKEKDTIMMSLPHRVDRTITILAPVDTVFRFFTDSARWASWWGAGSTIDATPGGRVLIRHPGGTEVTGEVLEIAPPKRIVFTYGNASGA